MDYPVIPKTIMKKRRITVELSEAHVEALEEWLEEAPKDGLNGELNLSKLTSMLLEDVAMIKTRDGSWEASNMQTVLHSHGYVRY